MQALLLQQQRYYPFNKCSSTSRCIPVHCTKCSFREGIPVPLEARQPILDKTVCSFRPSLLLRQCTNILLLKRRLIDDPTSFSLICPHGVDLGVENRDKVGIKIWNGLLRRESTTEVILRVVEFGKLLRYGTFRRGSRQSCQEFLRRSRQDWIHCILCHRARPGPKCVASEDAVVTFTIGPSLVPSPIIEHKP